MYTLHYLEYIVDAVVGATCVSAQTTGEHTGSPLQNDARWPV